MTEVRTWDFFSFFAVERKVKEEEKRKCESSGKEKKFFLIVGRGKIGKSRFFWEGKKVCDVPKNHRFD